MTEKELKVAFFKWKYDISQAHIKYMIKLRNSCTSNPQRNALTDNIGFEVKKRDECYEKLRDMWITEKDEDLKERLHELLVKIEEEMKQ